MSSLTITPKQSKHVGDNMFQILNTNYIDVMDVWLAFVRSLNNEGKVKQSHYRPGQALRVPGG